MRFLLVAAAVLVPVGVSAQGAPGTNIAVQLAVGLVARVVDTVTIEYVVRNQAGSSEQLFHFTVDAPSPAMHILAPSPQDEWTISAVYRGRSIAEWVVLGDQMQPGDSSPPLRYSALGLPGIVTFWARGWVPPPPLGPADTLPVVAPSDPLIENSVPGKTVGVDPMPSDPAPAPLVSRLRGLLAESCQLGWITVPACGPLDAQLAAGTAALAGGSIPGAREALTSFVDAVTGGFDASGSGAVNDAAFWLLTVNAEFILSLLPAGGDFRGPSGAGRFGPASLWTRDRGE